MWDLKRFFQKQEKSEQPPVLPEILVGQWRTDPQDHAGRRLFGNVMLDFKSDGQLVYTVYEQEREGTILLQYWIEGRTLVTNQPSDPRIERTEFQVTDDGLLVLRYDEAEARYMRVEQD